MTELRTLFVVTIAAMLLFACGSGEETSGSVDASAQDATTDSTDRAPDATFNFVTDCPAAPPEADSACDTTMGCTYIDCEGSGVTLAQCSGGAWTLANSLCLGTSCGDTPETATTCEPTQLCVNVGEIAGTQTCRENPCAAGLQNECVCEQVCGRACIVSGTSVNCDPPTPCPDGNCPP